jgi:hypothetical protein
VPAIAQQSATIVSLKLSIAGRPKPQQSLSSVGSDPRQHAAYDYGKITMARISLDITEIERRMALVRANLAELVEQAAAYSGSSDEDLTSRRIAELEAELKSLTKHRDKLSRNKS